MLHVCIHTHPHTGAGVEVEKRIHKKRKYCKRKTLCDILLTA